MSRTKIVCTIGPACDSPEKIRQLIEEGMSVARLNFSHGTHAEHAEKIRITGDLKDAVAAQLVWCSWSPGYMNGVIINDQRVFEQEGPRYAYHVHRVPVDDLSVFKPGENSLKTGKTPKINGKMVHGMEVNWPGVMVLIQYRRS